MAQQFDTDTGVWADDEKLQQHIVDRIDSDPAFWTGQGRRRAKTAIAVEVEDGYVTLSGVVRSASEKRRADLLARARGARCVDNRLQVATDADAESP